MTTTTTSPDWGVLARAMAADGVAEELVYERRWTCERGHEVFPERYKHPADAALRCPISPPPTRAVCGAPVNMARIPRDFTRPEVIFPVAEAWRRRDPDRRHYSMNAACPDSDFVAWAVVQEGFEGSVDGTDDEQMAADATDDPTSLVESLALALLAWAEAQEVPDGE